MAKLEPKESLCPLWMMTFGDCMSLLVTFFVMLIAFSNVEKDQLMETLGAMKGALSLSESTLLVDPKIKASMNYARVKGMSNAKKWLSLKELSAVIPNQRMAIARFGRPKVGGTKMYAFVEMLDIGMAFVLYTEPYFKEGKADVLPGSDEIFKQIGVFSSELKNEIRIVGVVTEDTKVASKRFKTPLGLGLERAVAVKKALCAESKFAEYRFSVSSRIGEGGKHGNGISAERVEIIIIGSRDLKNISPEEIVVRDRWE